MHTVVSKLGLSSDFYDARRTGQPSGGHRSEGFHEEKQLR